MTRAAVVVLYRNRRDSAFENFLFPPAEASPARLNLLEAVPVVVPSAEALSETVVWLAEERTDFL
jgi:hypothetical protein